MDGLAIATAVIQFIEFTTGLVNKGISIHSSASGQTVDHHELESITKSLEQTSEDIQESITKESQQQGRRQLTGNDRELQRIAADCQKVANELLDVLSQLASKGPKSKWRSFRQALRATWNEGKIQALETRLDRFRQQLMMNVLNSLRYQADKSMRKQSSIQESVEKMEELQRSNMLVGDRFVEQMADGAQWRRELIQMIHEQGQGLSGPQPRNFKNPSSNAALAQENRIRQRLLHKLAFRNMADRERRISKAHQRTFEWIFCDPDPASIPWPSFKEFLEHPTRKVYWITGKPGSGKSTLMKYIRHDARTVGLLEAWGGGEEIVQAAFYFWNSGSQMQMSVEGLLQTVLHDCLRKLPKAVQKVLPERWEAATLFDVDDFPWTLEEVAHALRRLVTEVCRDEKFFFLIDGLDECTGNQTQLIELITELADECENLKLCVASRPWNNFEDAFRDRPSLRLQDLSAGDISWFIRSKFEANTGFAEFQVRDATSSNDLMVEISRKAEGVFLWVHLVVRSLLEGLTEGDSLRDLHRRLRQLPPDLEDLYIRILESLSEDYLDHASRLFQIARASHELPTLLCIALADLEDDERAMKAPVEPISGKEMMALCRNMKRKLMSRCRGLLDVSSSLEQMDEEDRNYENKPGMMTSESLAYSQNPVDMTGLEIQYLHRSVRDYIQSPEVWSWLISNNKEAFDPHLQLLKSHVLFLKGLDVTSLSASKMGFHVCMGITHAKRSLPLSYSVPTSKQRPEEKSYEQVLTLLDEIDKTAKLLTTGDSLAGHLGSTFVDRYCVIGEKHWSSLFISHVPNLSFLHMMAACGVHQYLCRHLPQHKSHDETANAAGSDILATLQTLAVKGAAIEGYTEMLGPHRSVLKVLLQNGALEDGHIRHKKRGDFNEAAPLKTARVFETLHDVVGPELRDSEDRFHILSHDNMKLWEDEVEDGSDTEATAPSDNKSVSSTTAIKDDRSIDGKLDDRASGPEPVGNSYFGHGGANTGMAVDERPLYPDDRQIRPYRHNRRSSLRQTPAESSEYMYYGQSARPAPLRPVLRNRNVLSQASHSTNRRHHPNQSTNYGYEGSDPELESQYPLLRSFPLPYYPNTPGRYPTGFSLPYRPQQQTMRNRLPTGLIPPHPQANNYFFPMGYMPYPGAAPPPPPPPPPYYQTGQQWQGGPYYSYRSGWVPGGGGGGGYDPRY